MRAQLDGFRADRFEMAPTVQDGIVSQGPSTLEHKRWLLSASLGLAATTLRVTPDEDTYEGIDVVGTRLTTYLGFALGLSDRFELAAQLPVALAQASESGMEAGFMIDEASTTAIGDLSLGGSVLALGERDSGPQLGGAVMFGLPTGSESSFTGEGGLSATALLTAGWMFPSVGFIANFGPRFRPEADYVTSNQGTELIARGGVLVPVIDKLTGTAELDAIMRTGGDDAFDNVGSPLLALLGARYEIGGGWYTGAGAGAGLTIAPGSPRFRFLLTAAYSPVREEAPPPPGPKDSDGDGYLDPDDECPYEPEDFDQFEDKDGCPDADNDQDGILDAADSCPRVDGETIEQTAEVYNEVEDQDGCPDEKKELTLEEVITLPAPIEFEYDKDVMLPGSEVYLRQVLKVLNDHPEVTQLEVQGHTSSEGGVEYNQRLSESRAKAVVKWLVDNGIDPSRLVAKGYGMSQPLVANDTEENRQRNRRVQFRLTKDGKAIEGTQVPPETKTPAPSGGTVPPE